METEWPAGACDAFTHLQLSRENYSLFTYFLPGNLFGISGVSSRHRLFHQCLLHAYSVSHVQYLLMIDHTQ